MQADTRGASLLIKRQGYFQASNPQAHSSHEGNWALDLKVWWSIIVYATFRMYIGGLPPFGGIQASACSLLVHARRCNAFANQLQSEFQMETR